MKFSKRVFLVLISITFTLNLNAQIHRPINWEFCFVKINNTDAVLNITANIEEGWKLYSQNSGNEGPLKTQFTFQICSKCLLVGTVNEPIPLVDDSDLYTSEIKYFKNKVVFSQRLRLRGTGARIKGSIDYMINNSSICLPPEHLVFDEQIRSSGNFK